MLSDSSPISFVHTAQPEKAKEFYQSVLGLELQHDNGFALVFRVGSTVLHLTRVDELTPQPFTIAGWKVEEIDHVVKELTSRGVEFERYPQFEQDEHGIWTVPGAGAKVAWFKDPDGNTLSLSQD